MLYDKIKSDLTAALKERREFDLGVLRMIVAVFSNRMIEKKGEGKPPELNDEEVLLILKREMKKRTEAAALFAQGGRGDLEAKEKKEAELIKTYLPEEMSDAELQNAVASALAKAEKKDFGSVMKEAVAAVGGKADGRRVSEEVKKQLSG